MIRRPVLRREMLKRQIVRMTVPTLVSLADAYRHLKLPPSADGSPSDADADLQQKIDAATSHVCGYITDRQPVDVDWLAEVESWTPDTAPPEVVLAILRLVADFDRYRGDDPDNDKIQEPGVLPLVVRSLLVRFRDPVIA
jgi:hypothetical protein